MKIAFYSNFLNHHQLPFCKKMVELIGEDFTFVATMPFNQKLVSKGYKDMNKAYPFVLTTYDSEDNKRKAIDLAYEADVMIMEPSLTEFGKERIKSGKLLFKYCERPMKKKLSWYKYLYHWHLAQKRNPTEKAIYVLSASAFTSGDYAKLGLFKNKCYKWGYFPEVKMFDADSLIKGKKTSSILWAGRLIDWKHPELAIEVGEKLKNEGFKFELNIIGDGPLYETLSKMISEKNLSDCVTLLGALPAEDVRKYMEESEIYLFTSDRQEGWGAVLNESMSSGCAVVASSEIGSVPFLLKDGINGYIYEDGNFEDLYDKVKKLCANKEKRQQMGFEAYKTVAETWNAENAANRLMLLIEDIQKQEYSVRFVDGPCSKAEIIKDGWFNV